MIKGKLQKFFKISLKEVNGVVKVDFKRRFGGAAYPIDKTRLQQAIQRAERLILSPVIAETAQWDPDERIKVKRSMHHGMEFIEVINVPRGSSVAAVVHQILRDLVTLMYGRCVYRTLNFAEVHALNVVPDGKKQFKSKEFEFRDFEDEILSITMTKLTILQNEGHDIHKLDRDMIRTLKRSVKRELKNALAIDFRMRLTSPFVTLDG
jgi:hypothetical protein